MSLQQVTQKDLEQLAEESYKEVVELIGSAKSSNGAAIVISLTNGHWQGLLRAISANAFHINAIRKGRSLRGQRIAALEKRLDEIESKGVAYRGVWQAADEYQRGNLATHAGGIWHANTSTRARPGTSADWTLAVKGGDR
jgi:hypothetical protein